MSQAGWYQDPAAPFMVRWWDGDRWTNDVRPQSGGPDPTTDLADETKSGRLASQALWVGAACIAFQGFIAAELAGRVFHAIRDQLDAPLRSDGTRAPLVLPHSVTGFYALSQLGSIALLIVEVIFLIWFYKAANIAARAGLPAMRSPVWSILGWIVPIISLWFPYQVARDLFPPGDPGRQKVKRWWALYLCMQFSVVLVIVASFASTALALGAALIPAGLAFAAASAARALIDDVDRVHAGLLGR